MWCGEQSVPAVSNCTHEGGHLTSHFASARAKQIVHDSCSLCLTQQKQFLAPSTSHAVTYNTTCSQSQARFLTTSLLRAFDIESQFASRSCGDSTMFLCFCRSCARTEEVGLIVVCSTNLGGNGVSTSASSLLSSWSTM